MYHPIDDSLSAGVGPIIGRMKLYAISDLHLGHEENRRLLSTIGDHRDDWLILAGDLGESNDTLRFALDVLAPRFAQLVWVPGNHDLWSTAALDGEAKYLSQVAICREFGVLGPEDDYVVFPHAECPHLLVPMFLLYDYSFRPDEISLEEALDWAWEEHISCADERYLSPTPFADISSWCAARCDNTEKRLAALTDDLPRILINHFPLRRDLAVLPRIPRFSLWCGTRRSEDWHLRFNASVVVAGHLHIPSRQMRDDVFFEEVSLGYPKQWKQERGIESYLRQILPRPENPKLGYLG